MQPAFQPPWDRLERLLIWPSLIFSPLNAREALINFYFNLSGALSQLTVVLIIVVFGQRERCVLTRLCCLEVLQKIHRWIIIMFPPQHGGSTWRLTQLRSRHTQPVFMLSPHRCIKYVISCELFSLLLEQLKGEHVCMFHPAGEKKSPDEADAQRGDALGDAI